MSRAKASPTQLSYLVEHMKNNTELASGRLTSTLQGRADFDRQWVALAEALNSLGGPMKTVIKWKQTWRDLRNNVKKKASHNRNEFRGYGPGSTGNGPSTLETMSTVDEDVLTVMGPVAVYGMEDVAITEISTENAGPSQAYTLDIPHPLSSPVPVLPAPPAPPTPPAPPVVPRQARKRKRTAPKLDSFDAKLLVIEEEKLKIKREKNSILNR